ncbi:hypothetical protein D9615_000469 [Tricholomella constricta]|uniref:Uncharacterized protein n=1 Tax=Tricholomella constricta TaxID=117010 RepID=A0A8H5HS12_9AGAR|nr:hypothetical protein D9615_000469 [Tricholomella constricta]
MDDSTSKFHDARAYAVLPISPALAALYTHQSPPPQNNSDWCSKCGAYLLDGTAEVRVVRLKSPKRRHPTRRVVRITCQSCGCRVDVPTSSGTIQSTPSDLVLPAAPSPISLPPSTSTPSPLPIPPVSSSSTQTKSRNKKKTGLQVLLSRNREKEAAQERSGGHSDQISGGLAAFLSGL